MEEIESKIRVDVESAPFKWIKSLTFVVGQFSLTPDKRDDQINAIILLTCFHLMKNMRMDPQTMNPADILQYSTKYLPEIVMYYCRYYLEKKSVTISSEISESLSKKIFNEQYESKMNFALMDRINGKMTVLDIFSSVSYFSLNQEVEPKVVIDLCTEFIPFVPNVSLIEELKPGDDVCGYTLVSLASKTDMSEIWKAKSKNRDYAIKLEDLDIEEKELKKMLKSSSYEKIVEYIKETDKEFLGYSNLKDFPYKLDYFRVDYYNPLNKKVKIMSWLEGPVDKVPVENKKQFMQNIAEILFELHRRGLVFNNVSPHHVMVKLPTGQYGDTVLPNRLRLIDYKNVTQIKGSDGVHEDSYRSLALLSGSPMVTIYDDIESLFFLMNTLINGEISYSDLNDERLKKTQLTSFSHIVSEAIIKLRTLRQNDIYANSVEEITNIKEYVETIYKQGLRGSQGEILPSILKIITDFITAYREVSDVNIKLTLTETAQLKNIRVQMASDPYFQHIVSNPAKFNDITIKILNFVNFSCEYSQEDQLIINQFLSGNNY